MRTHKFTPETAGKILVTMLEHIIDANQNHCEGINDSEGITDHDNLMAAGIVSRIDYDEQLKKFILTGKDTLHQGRTGDETEQDVEVWAMRFLNKHGEDVLYQLLARQFVRLLNESLLGITTQKRPDRQVSLSETRFPQEYAAAR